MLLRRTPRRATTRRYSTGGEAFIGCDHEWRGTHLNARAQPSWHRTAWAVRTLGQNIWYALPGLTGSRFQAEAFRAHAQGTEVELEEFVPAAGRWFSIRMAPTSNGLVAYARQVPDHTHAEHALHASEERYRHLAESIDDVVFRLDREQRCMDAFGRWLEREGVEPASLIGRTVREIVGPDAAPQHEEANLKALAGETITYEWMLITPRGHRHMQTTLSPVHGRR